MDNTIYVLETHISLLKLEQNVKSQNKSFFKENKGKCLELSNYNYIIDRHIF